MTRTEEGVWMTRNVTSTETHSKGVKEFHHVHEWRIAGSTNDHWYEACWLSVLAISSIIGSQIGETANPEINRNTDKDKGRNIGVFQREELLGSLEVITRCVSRCMIQTMVLSLSYDFITFLIWFQGSHEGRNRSWLIEEGNQIVKITFWIR